MAAAYLKYGELPWIQDMFYGVGAAVIAIIGQSAYRLSRKTIGADLFLWVLFAGVAITTVHLAFCAVRCLVHATEAASAFSRQNIAARVRAPWRMVDERHSGHGRSYFYCE